MARAFLLARNPRLAATPSHFRFSWKEFQIAPSNLPHLLREKTRSKLPRRTSSPFPRAAFAQGSPRGSRKYLSKVPRKVRELVTSRPARSLLPSKRDCQIDHCPKLRPESKTQAPTATPRGRSK